MQTTYRTLLLVAWIFSARLGEVMPALAQDCNNNGIDDTCDIDCNAAGCAPPDCGGSPDCNTNAVPDECDVSTGTSCDINTNGTPDECEFPECVPVDVVFIKAESMSAKDRRDLRPYQGVAFGPDVRRGSALAYRGYQASTKVTSTIAGGACRLTVLPHSRRAGTGSGTRTILRLSDWSTYEDDRAGREQE